MRIQFYPHAEQGKHIPSQDSCLGRLVNCYHKVFIVVHEESKSGSTRLYLAQEQGDDGRPVGMWAEKSRIAAPGMTILHWDRRTGYHEPAEKCAALYKAAIEAEEQRKEECRQAEAARMEEEARCEQLWEEFTPEWAKAYLVAELREDKSDTMQDYFGYSITETVFLGFSRTERNSFPEMRKVAASFPPAAHLATAEGIEHRENQLPPPEVVV